MREPKLARFGFRLDLFDEVEVRLFGRRIVGVTGHGDVTLGALFVESGAELAPIEQPALEWFDRLDARRGFVEAVEEREDLVPIAQVCKNTRKKPATKAARVACSIA